MSTDVNLNWWQRQHPAVKVLIVVGSLGLVTWGGYSLFGPKKEDKKLGEGNGGTNSNNEGQSTQTNTNSETTNSTNHVETNNSQPGSDATLPAGKTCGPLHDDFDDDFYYAKCDGEWQTKSKPTAKTYKNKYPDWVDIKTHATDPKLAAARLNARYQN